MNAVIDIGNTRIKLGLFENNELIEVLRFANHQDFFEVFGTKNIAKTIISSVVSFDNKWLDFISQNNALVLNHETSLPIINLYKTPLTLGYDRIAAACGANMLFENKNCLIVDMGTAVKYDYINAKAEFIGGIISLGRQMRFKALHTFTNKLPLLDQSTQPLLIGTSTESCMASGVINGLAAELNGIIEEYQKLGDLTIIISGGDAPNFESRIKYPTFAAPNIVLIGLNRILDHNVL